MSFLVLKPCSSTFKFQCSAPFYKVNVVQSSNICIASCTLWGLELDQSFENWIYHFLDSKMFIVNFAQCLKFVFFNYLLSSQSIMWFMFILLILLRFWTQFSQLILLNVNNFQIFQCWFTLLFHQIFFFSFLTKGPLSLMVWFHFLIILKVIML
jgi:hypothetical protein